MVEGGAVHPGTCQTPGTFIPVRMRTNLPQGHARWGSCSGPSLGRPRSLSSGRQQPMTTTHERRSAARTCKNAAHQDPRQDPGQKDTCGQAIADHRGLGAGLVGVRENSDLREFLFGGVDLRHRMSHAFAPHVPLGVVLRVVLEGIAAARVSTALTAPVPERLGARTPTRAARPRRSPLKRAPNDQCPTHSHRCCATDGPSSDLHARHRSVDRWLVHHLAQFAICTSAHALPPSRRALIDDRQRGSGQRGTARHTRACMVG